MIQQTIWRPITMLPVFMEMVDGMLQTSYEQLGCLQLVYEKQHVLGNTVISRLIKQYEKQSRDHWLLEGQLEHWQQGDLRLSEKRAIERLVTQASQLKENSRAILKVADAIERIEIESVVSADELTWLQAWGSAAMRSRRSSAG